MFHFFISYSRKDKDIASRIFQALKDKDLEIWIDWEDIPKGEEWEQEINRGIEGAEAFLYLTSPDSIKSKVCNQELEYAIANNKRILPVIIRDPEPGTVQDIVSKLNWIFCRDEQDDFSRAITEILEAFHTDYKWLKYHTYLQNKALEWERSQKDASRLLRGKELREAEKRCAETMNEKEPLLTDLQHTYLLSSQKHEKKLRSWLIGSSAAAVLAIVGFAIWPFLSRERPIPGTWVTIPAGSFTMGMDRSEAENANRWCLDHALKKDLYLCTEVEGDQGLLEWDGRLTDAQLPEYQILDNEVTNAQYKQCVDEGGCIAPDGWTYKSNELNFPATKLNWHEATAYCEWLGGRLPLESEWEKTARGPDNNSFPWGMDWEPENANLENWDDGKVESVLKFAETDISGYGVKNMAGNVREWTGSMVVRQKKGEEFSYKVLTSNETLSGSDFFAVLRGGEWDKVRSLGMSAMRRFDLSSQRSATIGFRCVCPESHLCNSPWSQRWIWFGE